MSTSLNASAITTAATANVGGLHLGGLITNIADKWIGNILTKIEGRIATIPATVPVDPNAPLAHVLTVVDEVVDEAMKAGAALAIAMMPGIGIAVAGLITTVLGPDLKAAINAAITNGATNWATAILTPPVAPTPTA